MYTFSNSKVSFVMNLFMHIAANFLMKKLFKSSNAMVTSTCVHAHGGTTINKFIYLLEDNVYFACHF